MNERIKELSKQAWEWAEQQEYNDPAQEFSDILEQKFAELIVRECAKAVEYSIWHLPRGYKAVDQAAFVKKHFGIQ